MIFISRRPKRLNLIAFLFGAFLLSQAQIVLANRNMQAIVVTGNVVDQNQIPLTGATVIEKGSSNGTICDIDGNFSLMVQDPKATLVFSFTGFISQELPISNKMDIVLKEDTKQLDEVIVVGYQSMRKSDLTGAISSIKSDELNLTAPAVGQALVGKVAGVQISQSSGAPYANSKIRVRGTSSINASSDPLYVIDGYPSTTDAAINPDDIESIEILKDAASAAIYGSRASGGVVLITTKRGKEGKPVVRFDFQTGVNQLAHKIKLLNSDEFAQLMVDGRNNAYRNIITAQGEIPWNDAMYSDVNSIRGANTHGANNSGISLPDFVYDFPSQTAKKQQYNTDWQDELYRNAVSTRYNFSVSGGSKSIRYQLSTGYQDNNGIIPNSGQKRLNLRANIDAEISSRFTIGANLSLSDNWNKESGQGRFNDSPPMAVLVYAPFLPAYNADGSLALGGMNSMGSYAMQGLENPIAQAKMINTTRIEANHTYNVFGVYKLASFLKAKASLAMTDYSEKYEKYYPAGFTTGVDGPYSIKSQGNSYNNQTMELKNDYLGELTLNFDKSAGKNNINGVLGYSMEQNLQDVISVHAKNFSDDKVQEITAHGPAPTDISLNSATGKSNWSMISFFSRVNYSYDSRYFLTASIRGDGCSVFGPNNRWGYFPSVSAGWKISEEDFYKNNLGEGSNLKLRASWGLSGNNSIGNYSYAQYMNSNPGSSVLGGTINSSMYPASFKDSNLGWESTSQLNFGADIGFLRDKVSLSINYYVSDTYNLLFNQSISAVSGSTSVLTNLPNSKIRNQGLDFQLDTRIISTVDFDLGFSGNISFNKNQSIRYGRSKHNHNQWNRSFI